MNTVHSRIADCRMLYLSKAPFRQRGLEEVETEDALLLGLSAAELRTLKDETFGTWPDDSTLVAPKRWVPLALKARDLRVHAADFCARATPSETDQTRRSSVRRGTSYWNSNCCIW